MCQVFQNLVINASQAMPKGGVIKIKGRNVELAQGEVPQLAEGEYVEVTVQDNGTGIDKMHIDKVFDPYFSTKRGGSGLGLAVVYSIIKNHEGLQFIVESRAGHKLYLAYSRSYFRPKRG